MKFPFTTKILGALLMIFSLAQIFPGFLAYFLDEKEYVQRVTGETDTTLEEKFVAEIEKGPQPKRKSSSGKNAVIIGVIAVIIIGGGAGALFMDFNFDSDDKIVVTRVTCDDTQTLVSSTIIPGFPDPEKDLQHYLDRYNNEPTYADWFDRNFPGQTIQEAVC